MRTLIAVAIAGVVIAISVYFSAGHDLQGLGLLFDGTTHFVVLIGTLLFGFALFGKNLLHAFRDTLGRSTSDSDLHTASLVWSTCRRSCWALGLIQTIAHLILSLRNLTDLANTQILTSLSLLGLLYAAFYAEIVFGGMHAHCKRRILESEP